MIFSLKDVVTKHQAVNMQANEAIDLTTLSVVLENSI